MISDGILLGVVQGLTEFLPVSSDGHLGLASLLFGIKDGGLALNVFLHAGTLLATFLVLRVRVGKLLQACLEFLRAPAQAAKTEGGRELLFILWVTIPTGIVGLLLRHPVEKLALSPLAIGLGFLGTTAALLASRRARAGELSLPSFWHAGLIGLIQGLAVLPGLSRSGSTIALLLLTGVRRERAFELSMLMSLPAVAGAVLLEVPELLAQPGQLGVALVGAATAFVTGLFALVLVRRTVIAGYFHWFAAWVLPVALATLALSLVWPR